MIIDLKYFKFLTFKVNYEYDKMVIIMCVKKIGKKYTNSINTSNKFKRKKDKKIDRTCFEVLNFFFINLP